MSATWFVVLKKTMYSDGSHTGGEQSDRKKSNTWEGWKVVYDAECVAIARALKKPAATQTGNGRNQNGLGRPRTGPKIRHPNQETHMNPSP